MKIDKIIINKTLDYALKSNSNLVDGGSDQNGYQIHLEANP